MTFFLLIYIMGNNLHHFMKNIQIFWYNSGKREETVQKSFKAHFKLQCTVYTNKTIKTKEVEKRYETNNQIYTKYELMFPHSHKNKIHKGCWKKVYKNGLEVFTNIKQDVKK